MDLRSENPYWLLKNGFIKTYPSLQENIKGDIAIIGAGITGALAAWHLVNAGFKVIVIDKRHVGMGSTSASTGLLQYEIDTPLNVLSKKVGEQNAIRSYKLCRDAIYRLKEISSKLAVNSEFELKPSLQFASGKRDIVPLKKEYDLRKKNGFDVEWLARNDISNLFGFDAPAGILSADGAEVNAYKLTHGLLAAAHLQGLLVYDNTSVTSIGGDEHSVTLKTSTGFLIHATNVVIAGGYESQNYLPKKIETWYSTYAIISEPIPLQNFWHRNAMIWETAIPYLYLRTTADNRIIIGGLDDSFKNALKRDRRVPEKATILKEKFNALFPELPFKIDFEWAGTFTGTKDGLPYIGAIKGKPNIFFALGYGGNGITFSEIAAQVITCALLGKSNADAAIFSFDR